MQAFTDSDDCFTWYTTMRLEVFTDFVCPWCYLGVSRLDKLREEIEFDLQWVYFPLHPETPADGLTLEELFDKRDVDLDQVHRRLSGLMEAEGLPYGNRTHTYNSRLAQELAKWADGRSEPTRLHRALYEAYFVDGRNLADTRVLLDVAASSGLPLEEARHVLEERTFSEEVTADWKKASRYGVTSVPTFVVGNRGIAGAQPADILRDFLRRSLAEQPSE